MQFNLKKIAITFPVVLVFLEIITFLSTDMYLPALPQIGEDFGIDQDMAQYTQTAWFLGSMSMQLLLGPITEKFGRRSTMMIGIILFILASFSCATSNNINMFLLSRFIQGTTVCVVIVAGYATIHELYSGARAIQIMAIMGSVTILAPALGPFLGALIITQGDWHDIFALLTVGAMIGLIGVYYIMPHDHKNHRSKVDKNNDSHLLASIKYYHAIFTNPRFMSFALINCFIIICFFAWIVQSPFIIIKTYQKSEIYFGLVQLLVFSSFIGGAQTAKRLITKLSAKRLCDLGLAIICGSIVLFTVTSYVRLQLELIIIGMLGIAFGAAMLSSIWNRLAIESCEQPMAHRVAVYSTMVSFFASFGSYLVTHLNDQTFLSLAMLMMGFVIVAVNIFFTVRPKIKLA